MKMSALKRFLFGVEGIAILVIKGVTHYTERDTDLLADDQQWGRRYQETTNRNCIIKGGV